MHEAAGVVVRPRRRTPIVPVQEHPVQLWKVDTKAWTVRPVEGEPYPAQDREGDTCYKNTHFPDEAAAWERLAAEVAARVSLAGRSVVNAQAGLDRARCEAADAAAAFVRVQDQLREREASPQGAS